VSQTDRASRVIAAPRKRVFDGVEIRTDDVPGGITAEDHAAGMASSLANLAAYLEH
jgi:hypothetical protein